MTEDYIKPNGCYSESGYDAFEKETREQFESYAGWKGYNLKRIRIILSSMKNQKQKLHGEYGIQLM